MHCYEKQGKARQGMARQSKSCTADSQLVAHRLECSSCATSLCSRVSSFSMRCLVCRTESVARSAVSRPLSTTTTLSCASFSCCCLSLYTPQCYRCYRVVLKFRSLFALDTLRDSVCTLRLTPFTCIGPAAVCFVLQDDGIMGGAVLLSDIISLVGWQHRAAWPVCSGCLPAYLRHSSAVSRRRDTKAGLALILTGVSGC